MLYAVIFAAHNNVGKLLLSKEWLFYHFYPLQARRDAVKKVEKLNLIFKEKRYELLTEEGFIPYDVLLLCDLHSYHLSLNFVHSMGVAIEIWGDKTWALENLQEEASIMSKVFNVETVDLISNGNKFTILMEDIDFLI